MDSTEKMAEVDQLSEEEKEINEESQESEEVQWGLTEEETQASIYYSVSGAPVDIYWLHFLIIYNFNVLV